MHTWCERDSQVEIGVVEYEGRHFAALGATVVGRQMSGYTRKRRGCLDLVTWCGKTMLGCRSQIIEKYHDDSLAIIFRLTQGRFIVGYALGDNGMLFRGELLAGSDDKEAHDVARSLADYWSERDAEDEEDCD